MLSKNEMKFIKSLKVKKYRVLEKRFIVDGIKNVEETIRSDFEIELIISTVSCAQRFRHTTGHIRNEIVSEEILTKLGNYVSNKECIAIVRSRNYRPEIIDLDQQLFLLDGVSDPGNLGTIIRTLDWFGFHQLVCSKDTVELYNPKVIAASAGSICPNEGLVHRAYGNPQEDR